MRSQQQMLDLIVGTAEQDERIRVVIMNGSRANPEAPQDIFQDFDIVYLVTDIAAFKNNPEWIKRFGEIMIMQMPDDMEDPPPSDDGGFAYLMQFTDGHRIDLNLFPVARLNELEKDSQSLLLVDKDGIMGPFDPPSDADYRPRPPTAKAFSDCCNEFWWVCPYVAKGLWREEIVYAKYVFERAAREQLMKMLIWYVGQETQFTCSPGKYGKYLKHYLEPALWAMLEKTYSDASYEGTWEALHMMCNLFRMAATRVARHFGFDYPHTDDSRVSAHLQHVRSLPKNATQMY
ncbi:MAG TPA: aminoglycoside 6-adenylyltransferase [Anaerolineales bacterium]|jgi:aminoglycoside 6-adenylyltransferase|nr:aminoglycoside 6-adenylyltransferase [Anaerolineales bacterium]